MSIGKVEGSSPFSSASVCEVDATTFHALIAFHFSPAPLPWCPMRTKSGMKYGQIAGNESINAMIYRCFEHVHEQDAPKFVKKFKNQLKDNTQVMHTFRELILGAYLATRGLNVRYEYRMDGETPDWCVLDDSGAPMAIVELVNFHPDRATEDSIATELQERGLWGGWQQSNERRLYDRIQQKANTYKAVVVACGVSYIIAVFSEFAAAVNADELNTCLSDKETGIFGQYPLLTGLLFFEECSGRYQFTYMPNPRPSKRLNIPSGEF